MPQDVSEVGHAYGRHPDQLADLVAPAGDPPAAGWPTVVVIHGGFWRERYRRDLTAPLARDLASAGLAAWNVEFRRVGGDGGWPATFEDLGAAIDRLAAPELPTDPTRTAVVGHSAGGHLAMWVAGRAGRPGSAPGADPLVVPRGVVGLAPVADLAECHRSGLSDGAAHELLGGGPDEVAERWMLADPVHAVGHGIPMLLIHGLDDTDVPVGLSEGYAAVARAAGDPVELVTPPADHMSLIDPATAAWGLARDWLSDLLTAAPGDRQRQDTRR